MSKGLWDCPTPFIVCSPNQMHLFSKDLQGASNLSVTMPAQSLNVRSTYFRDKNTDLGITVSGLLSKVLCLSSCLVGTEDIRALHPSPYTKDLHGEADRVLETWWRGDCTLQSILSSPWDEQGDRAPIRAIMGASL